MLAKQEKEIQHLQEAHLRQLNESGWTITYDI